MEQEKENKIADEYYFGGNTRNYLEEKGFEIAGEINLPMHAYFLKSKDSDKEELSLTIGGGLVFDRELCHNLTEVVAEVLYKWIKEPAKPFTGMGEDFYKAFMKHCDETGRTLNLTPDGVVQAPTKGTEEEEDKQSYER